MHSPKTNTLLEGPIWKSLLTLTIPVILSNILQAGYQLTDAFWVGRLGKEAVASVSIAGPVIFLTIALGVGLAIAGSTLISQYFGARNKEMVNHVASQTLLMIVTVSTVLGAIGFIFTPQILKALGVTPDFYTDAVTFMRVSFLGLASNFFFFMFQSIMRGVGEAKLPVYIVLGTVILNFFLDPLFIFGFGVIPPLGVTGAALATLITQTIAALAGLYVLLKGKYGIHLYLRDFIPDVSFIKRAFFLGLPASIEQTMRAFGMIVLTFLVASFGTLNVAAYGAGSNMLQVAMIPALGLSMALSALIGQNIGAKNIPRAQEIARFGAKISFLSLSVLGIITALFAAPLMRFFVPSDESVVLAATTFLQISALSWGFMGIQFALNGALRAAGNMNATMMLAIISLWVIQLPMAYFLSHYTVLQERGLWWSFTISNAITAALTILWYLKTDWKKANLTEETKTKKEIKEEALMDEGAH